jgi:hypothetical protein
MTDPTFLNTELSCCSGFGGSGAFNPAHRNRIDEWNSCYLRMVQLRVNCILPDLLAIYMLTD